MGVNNCSTNANHEGRYRNCIKKGEGKHPPLEPSARGKRFNYIFAVAVAFKGDIVWIELYALITSPRFETLKFHDKEIRFVV